MSPICKVLFVASEAAPLLKTGGLADVAGALPKALYRLGVDVRLLLPAYRGLLAAANAKPVLELPDIYPAWGRHTLCRGTLPGSNIPVYLLASSHFYVREGGPYQDRSGKEWIDNPQRFALLSKVAALFASSGGLDGFQPDIVHANDWQTGLTAAYLKQTGSDARTVFSIHNLAYQGNFSKHLMPELGLDWSLFTMDGLEFHDQISFLKSGIAFSDQVLTVSPTYAREITTPEQGFGLDGILRTRSDHLQGILNGIDIEEWDPRFDPLLARNFTERTLSEGKRANRQALSAALGLQQDPDGMMVGMVSRLAWQKGCDLVQEVAGWLVDQGAQLAILGSGDAALAGRWHQLAALSPGRIGFQEGYDDRLAHLIEAGSDLFLMPSRFEPCGLNQMYSHRYGTLPLVTATGGLADTVIGYDRERLDANGFVMTGASVAALQASLSLAMETRERRTIWRGLQRNAMKTDYSWKKAADSYIEVYKRLLG